MRRRRTSSGSVVPLRGGLCRRLSAFRPMLRRSVRRQNDLVAAVELGVGNRRYVRSSEFDGEEIDVLARNRHVVVVAVAGKPCVCGQRCRNADTCLGTADDVLVLIILYRNIERNGHFRPLGRSLCYDRLRENCEIHARCLCLT